MALVDEVRRAGFGCLAGAFLAVALAFPARALSQSPPSDAHLHSLLQAAATGELYPASAKYVGPGGCAASACHGGIRPSGVTKVLQNEYSTWVTADKHAQAYTALTEPLGKQIASILKLGPPQDAPRCLICHALDVPASQRARDFDLADGVSCESCHGPASLWLGPHIQANAVHAEMVKLGLYDNQNLKLRAEKCMTCHLGAPGMFVDHEMIAAGHPDLTFELDSFTAVEPPHWIEKKEDGRTPADSLFGVRAWAVGQAVELRESLLRVSRQAKSGPWPEFSEMNCMDCHHALTGPQSWRQQQGYDGRRPGDPPYNLSHYVLFQHFAEEIDPQLNAQLAVQAKRVSALVSSMSPDREAVQVAANKEAELAGQMVEGVQGATYDLPRTQRLLASISGDANAIAASGERTAEQATMTLDSLYIAETKAGDANPATRSAIDGLFKLVRNPSAYNGPQFAAQMKRVHDTLR